MNIEYNIIYDGIKDLLWNYYFISLKFKSLRQLKFNLYNIIDCMHNEHKCTITYTILQYIIQITNHNYI